MEKMRVELKDYENDAINLYRSTDTGILSTISKKHDNYPFGSFVTYVTAGSRTTYLYLSDLAEHTKNLKHQSKACLTIFKLNPKGDKQNSERLALMGDLVPVDQLEFENCRERFHQILPDSKAYAKMHDFNFYKIQIKNIRWIGGFGKIAWLNSEDWKDNLPKWSKSEGGIIDHMNVDHADTIVSALKAQHGVVDNTAKMMLLTIDGYYLKSKSGIYFIKFPYVCSNAKEYKEALIELAKKYK
tara:strand:+ start:687 stop:1415 length:729 start_codon:yes stop_codon:yes gene_type:complete